ncbi:response regulator [Indioceanicola profundi]|uniref:response regulator n=1 Tax=Indioceanicola profundi TaxID=2220096 RepID=UPI000E6ACF5C|nr:response regulator [Indioceanicola profundi]
MTDGRKILIVDDEAELRELLTAYLGQQGFDVAAASGGDELDKLMMLGQPDLVLLDLGLPGEDGFSIARRLKKPDGSGPAIIMVTGAGTVVDRVVGLELGADDYVAKPFDLRELLARVRAVLRRGSAKPTAAAAPEADGREIIGFGPWKLDMAARSLRRQDGDLIELTAMEFDLLAVFATKPNRVLTRDQLLDMAHHRDNEPFDRSIDVRIARLRRKIEIDPARPQYIKTIRGAGYMFTPKGE